MENVNSCCYVARINEVKPIEGADNIEQAIINGWSCIVKKGSHQPGDEVVVATTDAIIPEDLAETLGVTNYLRKGNRVRTIKLRDVYSECLIIPIKYPKQATGYANTKWEEGDDLMDVLKISKYEPQLKQVQLASGRKVRWQDNPNFHVYYKFPNLKNVPNMFTTDDVVEITRKIHGTNARFGIVRKSKLSLWDKVKKFFGFADEWIDYEYVVGSYNVEKGSDSNGFYDTNVWYEIDKKYGIKEALWKYVKNDAINPEIGEGVILYGEIYGAGIQKGYEYGLNEIVFEAFDIKENGEYMAPIYAKHVTEDILGLPYVEILHYGNWSQEIQDKFTFKNFITGTTVPHEGIVIKIHTGEHQKVAKVINPDYLIYAENNDIGDSH